MADSEQASQPLSTEKRQISPARVVAATAGLVVGGGIAGAAAGMMGAVVFVTINESLRAAFEPIVLGFAGSIGGLLGAVIMPIAGFTLLRYVPLWRAFLETTLMTAIGGVIGVQFFPEWWLAGPITGFLIAAVRLWRLARRTRAHDPLEADG